MAASPSFTNARFVNGPETYGAGPPYYLAGEAELRVISDLAKASDGGHVQPRPVYLISPIKDPDAIPSISATPR